MTAAVVSITAVLVLHKTTAETQCRRDCHTLLSPDPAGMPPTLNSAVSCCAPFTLLERTLRWSELHSMLTESMRTIASRNLTGTIAAAVECLLRVPHGASRGVPRGYRPAAAPRLRGAVRAAMAAAPAALSIAHCSAIEQLHCVEDCGPLITSLQWNASWLPDPPVSLFHTRPICTALSVNLLLHCCDRKVE